jgi:hypothetical protein
MDEIAFFYLKWIVGVTMALLFILIGYIISPDDFTTVLLIIIGSVVVAIAAQQWGEKHVVD